MFNKDFLENEIFWTSPLSFDYYPDTKMGIANSKRSWTIHENGDVELLIGAPEAREVMVIAQFGAPTEKGYCPWEDDPVYGVKDEEGFFHVLLPYNENHTGSRSLKIYIDGHFVIWPYLPVGWGSNRVQNYIETPDEDLTFSYIYDVPHGAVISQTFYSSLRKKHERLMIYTPPGYMKGTEDYPVLYLLHGGSDNETTWFSRAVINNIFDNLLSKNECVPFICVCINDMGTYGEDSKDRKWEQLDGITEDMLVYEVIPFMEQNYRVKKDKWNRAVGGLSLGALQACDIGFRYPEVFGSMCFLTSILWHDSYRNAKGRPWEEALKHPEKIRENYKLIFCSATPQEDHFDYYLNDRKLMKEAGLEDMMDGYVYEAHDIRFTRWCSWRIGLRDFSRLLFR